MRIGSLVFGRFGIFCISFFRGKNRSIGIGGDRAVERSRRKLREFIEIIGCIIEVWIEFKRVIGS